MPSYSKTAKGAPRPSEVASEIKRIYLPWAKQWMQSCGLISGSVLFPDSRGIALKEQSPDQRARTYPAVTVLEGDPVDVALHWQDEINPDADQRDSGSRILVVNMANDRKPGGDWESGTIGPEECFARRSNLAQQLRTELHSWRPTNSHYPIPARGGIYTLNTIVFRDGADDYKPRDMPKCLPVVSVAPVRRPKLNASGSSYTFQQERELMLEKMRTILRIAAHCQHQAICLGPFGTGSMFRNPPAEVAEMWKQLLFNDLEFRGRFHTVIFAIDPKLFKEEYPIFSAAFEVEVIFPLAKY
ncbi:hypothetical protein BT63DRAFT_442180 [Microthyrium microscopicum]|uniref:Microbial-type PARG catalytic domain-containing protein n=1 Tax=Microthyrium microscopicum TaxID=703497 RepID=A0A6A6U7D2_9PEZI|nr:hypothetical protein BT63DRAFT_442180 [Microthyrium microscopicum]